MITEIHATGKTVNDAVAALKAKLSVDSLDDIDWKLVHTEKKGFLFGIGAQPAEVVAYVETPDPVEEKKPQKKAEPKAEKKPEAKKTEKKAEPKKVPEKKAEKPKKPKTPTTEAEVKAAFSFVETLVKNLELNVTANLVTDAENGSAITIAGDDAGMLIGHHGETLDAVQYLANLAANKNIIEQSINIIKIFALFNAIHKTSHYKVAYGITGGKTVNIIENRFSLSCSKLSCNYVAAVFYKRLNYLHILLYIFTYSYIYTHIAGVFYVIAAGIVLVYFFNKFFKHKISSEDIFSFGALKNTLSFKFSVPGWGSSRFFLESIAKIALRCKPCAGSNFAYGKIGILQKLSSMVNSDFRNIFMRRTSRYFFKHSEKMELAHMAHCGIVFNRIIFFIFSVHNLNY